MVWSHPYLGNHLQYTEAAMEEQTSSIVMGSPCLSVLPPPAPGPSSQPLFTCLLHCQTGRVQAFLYPYWEPPTFCPP